MVNQRAYDVITERILAALEEGMVPWRKPWKLPAGVMPQSVDGHVYRGINALMLNLTQFEDSRWLTYKKASQLGGQVRRGEKGMPIVFYKQFQVNTEDDDGNPKAKTIPLMRYFTVFNVTQCDGLTIKPLDMGPVAPIEPVQAAEAIIDGMPNQPGITHDGGDRAYYVPRFDSIHLPKPEWFETPGEYYSTAFHELSHATGHKTRLDRHGLETGIAPFGSDVYSREELAAEFGAAFLCHEAGIDATMDNSTAYIAGWAEVIRKDPKLVVQAASQGQKAAEYILAS
jgi:antirestriction protein ArdC